MRFGDAFITFITTFSILFIKETSPIKLIEEKCLPFNNGLWLRGIVPFAISHQFREKDLDLIKEALVDIMNSTCIKFVPHNNELDYVVFVEYKNPDQENRTCWSGKKWNNGSITVANQRGRHIVSLWRDLECFNKLDIILQMSSILGAQTKSSTLISKGAYQFYEEDLGTTDKKTRNTFISGLCKHESAVLRNHSCAFDNMTWVSIAKKDTCRVMLSLNQINRIYNCPAYVEEAATTSGDLEFVRPNCKAEAEAGTCKTDPMYMESIDCNIICDEWGTVVHGIPSPRRANLINALGKCLNVNPKNQNDVQQSNCNPNDKTMLWSWNEASLASRDRHICNGHGMCLAIPFNTANNELLIVYYHFLDLLAYPGFYIIKNDFGKCISVHDKTNRNGAEIWTNDCNPKEAGQRWKWSNGTICSHAIRMGKCSLLNSGLIKIGKNF